MSPAFGGAVTVGGRKRAELGEAAWLGQFGLLTQEFGQYEFTVRQAVALSTPDDDVSDEQIWAGTDAARAGEFVRAMPTGSKPSSVSSGADRNPGGQWQRLALARIYLRNAPIWILDEPTSAIDAEQEVFQELGRTKAERITIVVSHRAWTLLTEERLDLVPFRQPGSDRWRSGSGLPLGPLAAVQLYTTNANPLIEGKGHSPLCRHAHERAVVAGDDLLTIAELMARTDFDWCSKCGGYAMRGLSDSQLSYYSAAHQLHDIKWRLDGGSGIPGAQTSTVIARLDELAPWQSTDEAEWCSSDSWQWRDTIRELRRRVARSHAVTGPWRTGIVTRGPWACVMDAL
ncbi:ATP-binding cassette domain-containing protein [Streptomyces sp. NPDC002920]